MTSETRMTGNSLSRWNETYLIDTTVTAWNSECKRISVHAAIENHLDACAQPACMLGRLAHRSGTEAVGHVHP